MKLRIASMRGLEMNENDIPAFPRGYDSYELYQRNTDGMTLRDYMACQALLGLLILSPDICKANKVPRISKEDVAENAYMYADAMLKARKHEGEK